MRTAVETSGERQEARTLVASSAAVHLQHDSRRLPAGQRPIRHRPSRYRPSRTPGERPLRPRKLVCDTEPGRRAYAEPTTVSPVTPAQTPEGLEWPGGQEARP